MKFSMKMYNNKFCDETKHLTVTNIGLQWKGTKKTNENMSSAWNHRGLLCFTCYVFHIIATRQQYINM